MKKYLLIALMFSGVSVQAEGLMAVPGFDFIVERVKEHGYYGRAWDLKGRPSQTMALNMNNNGPVYISIGAYEDVLEKKWHALGGVQFDFLYLWRKASKTKLLERMGLAELPEDWKLRG